MEGEKERQRQQREEKESNEAEDDRKSGDETDNREEDDEDSEGAALVWQEGYGEDNLGLPIMHWEALSLRIAELEKQEEEKKEKRAKVRGHSLGEGSMIVGREEAQRSPAAELPGRRDMIFRRLNFLT